MLKQCEQLVAEESATTIASRTISYKVARSELHTSQRK